MRLKIKRLDAAVGLPQAATGRAAGFDRGLFVTICLLVAGDGYGISKAEMFGKLYEQVPVAAAQRAIRFWKVRKSNSASNQAA